MINEENTIQAQSILHLKFVLKTTKHEDGEGSDLYLIIEGDNGNLKIGPIEKEQRHTDTIAKMGSDFEYQLSQFSK